MKKALLRIVVCCAALSLVACGKAPEELLTEARSLHASGDRQAAMLQVKSLLQEAPDHAAARLLLGQLNLEAGDYAGAEKELRRALDGKADPVQVLPALAKALLMQGEAKKLLADVDPANITEPTAVARILSARGTAHLVLRQKEEAQAAFDKALSIKPGAPEALVGRARILASERKLGEALAEVDKALQGDAKDADALMMRGDLLRATGKQAEAEEAYKQLVAAHPQHVAGLLALVSLTTAANRMDDAASYLASVRKASPGNPMVAYFQGLIAFRKKDFKEARDAIGAVLKVAPNHLPSVLLGGAIEFALGSQELAQTRLKYVLERAPRNVYARRVLAASYSRAGQTQKALETLEPAISGGMQDPAMLALAGEVYMQLNEYEKAQSFFEKAAALDPKNARMRTGLGLSRLAAGDVDAATADLENASQLDTSRHHADVLLIATHLQRKQFDQALKSAQSLISKHPDSPVGHNLMAAAHLGMKDEKSARAALMKALEVQPTYVPAATNLAQLDLRKGDKKAARKWLEDIVARDKQNMQALLALASMGPSIGATRKETVEWLESARRDNPGALQPVILLTRLHLQAGEPKKATELVDKSLAGSPNNVELLELAGQVMLAAGEKNRALATFSRLVTLQPSAMSHFRMAVAQIANEDPSGAIKSLRQALALRTPFREAQLMLAETESRAGRIDDALKTAADYRKHSPKDAAGWVVEGDIRMRAKQSDAAAKAYANAHSMVPSGMTVMRLHSALVAAGKSADGEGRVNDWLKRQPGDRSTRLYFAEHLVRTKKFRDAAEHYELLAKQWPDNVVVLNNLAWAYLQIKDERAVATAEKALKLQPDNPAVADTLGWIFVQTGQVDRGVELLKVASERAPKSIDIRYHYAKGLAAAGNAKHAIEILESILVAHPDFPEQAEATRLLAQLRKQG